MSSSKILRAAREIQSFCERMEWQCCIIGGLAVQRWGEPRFTQDVDLTILTGFGRERDFISTLLEAFTPRRGDAAEFALNARVLLLKASNDVPLDVAFGGMPFEEHALARSSEFFFGSELSLRTCSAEDLVVYKAFANRTKDWLDVEGVLKRQGDNLDLEVVEQELKPLADLKEEPEIFSKLMSLAQRFGLRSS